MNRTFKLFGTTLIISTRVCFSWSPFMNIVGIGTMALNFHTNLLIKKFHVLPWYIVVHLFFYCYIFFFEERAQRLNWIWQLFQRLLNRNFSIDFIFKWGEGVASNKFVCTFEVNIHLLLFFWSLNALSL